MLTDQVLPDDMLVLHRKGITRFLSPKKYWINRNTPVGDDPDYYEEKPYNGRRFIHLVEILGTIVEGKLKIRNCNMTKERWETINSLGIPLDKDLFHNGLFYTNIEKPFLGKMVGRSLVK